MGIAIEAQSFLEVLELAHRRIGLGEGDAALALLSALIPDHLDNPELHRALAGAHRERGRLAEAVAAIEAALRLRPQGTDIWLQRLTLAVEIGGADEQLRVLDLALDAVPWEPRFIELKALALAGTGRLDAALGEARQAAAALPDAAWPQALLGRLLQATGRTAANEHLRRAVELEPANAAFRVALAHVLQAVTGPAKWAALDEAAGLILELGPRLPPTGTAIAANILAKTACLDARESLGDFSDLGRYWARNGAYPALLYQFARVRDDADRLELLEQHRLWGVRAGAAARANPLPRRPRGPALERIRVGILSSDLRAHAVGYFAHPLFEAPDPRFELFVYSFYPGPADSAQAWFARQSAAFNLWAGRSDRDAAQAIAAERLDMLIELGGATQHNRPGVLAYRPAPIQASWLGYPHSLGLAEVDQILVDPQMVPIRPDLLIETPLVLPQSWICMSPAAFRDEAPYARTPPAEANGYVTFGTANNPLKFNRPLIRTWARVLSLTPGSRFMIVRPEAGSRVFQGNVTAEFAAAGVAADRLAFRPTRGGHLDYYDQIDIALDTFPLTGGTTTCEALWKGVPTVTLAGAALYERLSRSILINAGLADLVTDSIDTYVARAVELAADRDRLSQIRGSVRASVRGSALGCSDVFRRGFFDALARNLAA